MCQFVETDFDGSIGTVTIDHTKKLNALSTDINDALRDAFDQFEDVGVDAVVLRTAGDRAFVSGADLSELHGMSRREFIRYQKNARRTNDTIASHPAPVIVAVDGFAYGGGCELVLASDMVVAEEGATFALPEVTLGLVPGGGATQRLPRVVGPNKAKEMLTTGKPIDAAEGRNFGLVNQVVDEGEAADVARELAETVAGNAPLAVREAKRLVNEGLDTPLNAGKSFEQEVTFTLYETHDAREGIEAFAMDRNPEFEGQ